MDQMDFTFLLIYMNSEVQSAVWNIALWQKNRWSKTPKFVILTSKYKH
jgi:hypothetical protein